MDQQLERLARSYSDAASLESLARPLLDLGQQVTGMESVYLTAIDEARGVQDIIYSHNTADLQMMEGLQVPWQDTLCRRALDEGRFVVDDVPSCWGDSEAAKSLGIKSYLSVPVYINGDQVFGTLCGASSQPITPEDNSVSVMSLCAQLIARQIERERSLHESSRHAEETERRLRRMALIADISRYCLNAQSLEDSVLNVAQQLNQTGLWQQVIPMRLRKGHQAGILGEWDRDAARLADSLIRASPESLEGMVHHDHEHMIFPPADLDWVQGYRQKFSLGDDADTALLVISTDEAVEAGLLVLSDHDLRTDPDERQLLDTIANSLSLLATRLLDHERLEQANAELRHYALHDTLTGLPNRRCLIEDLERMLANAARGHEAVHVAFIDLDGFKAINDCHGHDAGDEFLRQFGERLRQLSRQGDLIARYGGDEFVFVGKSETPNEAGAERSAIVRRIRQATSGHYELDCTGINYGGPSLGVITWHAGDPVDSDVALARADEAMYQDKQTRRRR